MSSHEGGSALQHLAGLLGILPEYYDQAGNRCFTSDATRERLLAAFGYAAEDEDAARRVLAEMNERHRQRVLARVRVVSGDPAPASRVELRLPDWSGRTVEWQLHARTEPGEEQRIEGVAEIGDEGCVAVTLPDTPTLGYHELTATVRAGGDELHGQQTLIVTPARFPSPAELLRGQRVFGLTANLYTVRSARDWGVGDLTDVTTLLDVAADAGAAFVGLSPLHALRNADNDISPYSPVSRLYRNPLYLDVEAVPELAESPLARALVRDLQHDTRLRALRSATHVRYKEVMALKSEVLGALHFHFRATSGRRRDAYDAWVAREGEALERFARFCALDEHFRPQGFGWWRDWPTAFQNPESSEVAAFAHDFCERVDYHRWVQFELDRQLGEAARRGRELGMPVGLYQDLAIGSSPAGADAWAEQELFTRGVSVGAPPDPLGPEGQNWGLPPLNPHRLASSGYKYWTQLVRGAMRHSGALRIDHVLGLFRQFWIPEGMSGRDGAYVRFPTEHLLGVLALEATRAGAIVVGEDLGTVPPEVPPAIARWGLLSSKVLYFERTDDGGFRSPRHYPRTALATANTHDLAPLAGYWRGRELALRRDVGLLHDDEALARAQRERERDRAALVALLVSEGILDPDVAAAGADGVSELDVRAGVHALLRRAPSWLVGLSLDDLVGETEPVNVPGVGHEDYASWTRRLSMPLEQLRTEPAVKRALGAERAWVP